VVVVTSPVPLYVPKAQSYEKAREMSAIINAIIAAKSIFRLDLRIRGLDGCAYPFSWRLNGESPTASTNRISFTYGFYQTKNPETTTNVWYRKTNLLLFMVMLENADE
jgi:hypothetical protein